MSEYDEFIVSHERKIEDLEQRIERLRKTCIALGMQVDWASKQLGLTMYEVAVASGTLEAANG